MTPQSNLMVQVPAGVNSVPATGRGRHYFRKMPKLSNHVHCVPPVDNIMNLYILVRHLTQPSQHIHYDIILRSPPASPIRSLVFLMKSFQNIFISFIRGTCRAYLIPLQFIKKRYKLRRSALLAFPIILLFVLNSSLYSTQ